MLAGQRRQWESVRGAGSAGTTRRPPPRPPRPPCSRAVNLPPSRTSGCPPPCSATRSLSADSNSTSEPSSSVNRTNSAITHPPRPPTRAPANRYPHPPAPAADPRPHTGNRRSCQAGRTPRPPGWFITARAGAGPSAEVITVRYRVLWPSPFVPLEPVLVGCAALDCGGMRAHPESVSGRVMIACRDPGRATGVRD